MFKSVIAILSSFDEKSVVEGIQTLKLRLPPSPPSGPFETMLLFLQDALMLIQLRNNSEEWKAIFERVAHHSRQLQNVLA